jgi:hypothetical protein
VRENVIAGEQQAGGGIAEDDVPPGVPGRGDDVEGPVLELQSHPAVQPLVRVGPHLAVGGVARRRRAAELIDQLGRAGGREPFEQRRHRAFR